MEGIARNTERCDMEIVALGVSGHVKTAYFDIYIYFTAYIPLALTGSRNLYECSSVLAR